MEFVQGIRRERYYCDEEEPEEPNNHHRRPPSSSSTDRWATQEIEPNYHDDHHPTSGSGASERRRSSPAVSPTLVEKEHMFDKVVTPSDVGKLNRLVIPKQHAEKYFPLDASANEKDLLLNFEDRTGKPWRFRYSYWNSSQSYVMTKGWSRFVKEKRLDAGDTVSFGRGVGESARDRLFIDWKRRPDAHDPPLLPIPNSITHHHHDPPFSTMSFGSSIVPWSRLLAPPPASAVSATSVYDHHRGRQQYCYGYNAAAAASNPYFYFGPAVTTPSHVAVQLGRGGGDGGAGSLGLPGVSKSAPVFHSKAAAPPKRVRLFGVNLDCLPLQPSSEADPVVNVSPLTALQASPRPLLSPLQLSLAAPSEIIESPRKDKQPMSLDLEM